MKTDKIIFFLGLFISCFFMSSCEDYLDKTLKADVNPDAIFTTFPTFQGFVERLQCDVVDFANSPRNGTPWNYGDDINNGGYKDLQNGNYWSIVAGSIWTQYCYPSNYVRGCAISQNRGIWNNGWGAIRDCNIAIAHFDDLKEATQDEKDVIKGQVYFLRAYFHWQIMKQWGNIPYSDKAFAPTDEMKIPQLSLYATAEKILADFQKSIEFLPVNWDAASYGQATLGINRGRLTKGMVYGYMAEMQLWCGSPLFNGTMTGDYSYNADYCKKAAASAWKVIELANQGVYALDPWETYNDNFKTNNSTEPARSKEIVFKAIFGTTVSTRSHIESIILPAVGGVGRFFSVTQNAVEWFEMQQTGLPIEDPASGFVPLDPWSGRDPRFRNSITVDGDRICESRNDALGFAKLFTGGRDRGSSSSSTGFAMRKHTFTTWNSYDNQWGSNATIAVPALRLAEVYLFYAEAANEGYGGPNGKDPSANLTALDAINKVRARANMPGVNAKFHNQTGFRDRVWNERAVELIFEAKRRDDLRRWHVFHLPKYKDMYSCEFPENHSSFEKKFVASHFFYEKHYWFPFPQNQVLLYKEWKQNPGW